eukprot:5739324-Prymnesium_polylepis.1
MRSLPTRPDRKHRTAADRTDRTDRAALAPRVRARSLGTLEELRNLTSAAHERGMYILIDIVVNHMANEFYFSGHYNEASPFVTHSQEYQLVPRAGAGTQPYADFMIDNTWVADYKYTGTYGFYDDNGN